MLISNGTASTTSAIYLSSDPLLGAPELVAAGEGCQGDGEEAHARVLGSMHHISLMALISGSEIVEALVFPDRIET